GTIHWVSGAHAVDAEALLYDRLFTIADTNAIPEDKDYKEFLNPESLKIVTAKLEPSLGTVEPGFKCQFERIGYFCADEKDHVPGSKPVFNRTVTLKDSWSKIAAK
ncbi:MAG: glutamine--tRNA ligase, partial [Lentisphaeria bacterium]|nr:glutamine--tRNA ligase [Lentisphaeria bacterium]